jgi:hypothetical protein
MYHAWEMTFTYTISVASTEEKRKGGEGREEKRKEVQA